LNQLNWKEIAVIGIVGPNDTADMIDRVAKEIGLNSALVVSKYKTPRETPDLVRTLLPVCSVILFSGRLPYRIARSAGFAPDNLDYIPHEGTDLFRSLALIALSDKYKGRIPKLSFDSIPERDAAEAYAELQLTGDHYVIPFEADDAPQGIDIGRILSTHRSLFGEGKVESCVTCIRSVYEALSELNIPVIRIGHVRTSIRQALLRAQLRDELAQAEASQVAICVLTRHPNLKPSAKQLSKTAQLCANLFGARILKVDESEALLITTRGTVDRHLNSQAIPENAADNCAFILGIGIGPNADQAEVFARQAQLRILSSATRYLQIERTVLLVEKVDPNEAREIRHSDLEISRNLQVSPAVIRRLGAAFKGLDPNGFTASEFAQGYDIQPRSARRLLTLLKERGFVEESGLGVAHRAGRPQRIYRIFLDRMLVSTL